MTSVAFVTVNYHTERNIAELVRSLRGQRQPWRLVILDNGSDARGREALETLARDPAIDYHRNSENLGYFGALHAYVGTLTHGRLPDWLVVTNPDIVLTPGFLDTLLEVDADVVAPRLRDAATGHDLNPFMTLRPSRWYSWSRRMVFGNVVTAQLWIFASWLAHRRATLGSPGPSRPVYAGHGALLALRRSYFALGGTLHHRPFLFGEELTIAENARRTSGVVLYVPELQAVHIGHVSTRVRRPRRLLAYQRDAARYVDDLISGRASAC